MSSLPCAGYVMTGVLFKNVFVAQRELGFAVRFSHCVTYCAKNVRGSYSESVWNLMDTQRLIGLLGTCCAIKKL